MKTSATMIGRVPPFRREWRTALAAVLTLLAMTPGAWTQYPVFPQPPALNGLTPGANLRDALAATREQAGAVRRGAHDWGRRANWNDYRAEHFQQDFTNMRFHFQTLQDEFNGLASLASGTGRPRALNAVAELGAGLNVIGELFSFLEGRFQAGTLDRLTIVRTCRAFEDAMRDWERELRKSSSRLGVVW